MDIPCTRINARICNLIMWFIFNQQRKINNDLYTDTKRNMIQHLFAKKDTYLSCVGQNSHRHEGCASLVACLYRQLISTEICLQQPSLVGLKHIFHGFALISLSNSSVTLIQVLTSTISCMLGWVQTGYTPTLLAWYSTALAPLQLYWEISQWKQGN